jgi:hypothetical protein
MKGMLVIVKRRFPWRGVPAWARSDPAALFWEMGQRRRMLGELIAVAERLENESEARRTFREKERDRIYTRLWVEHAERYPDFHRPSL